MLRRNKPGILKADKGVGAVDRGPGAGSPAPGRSPLVLQTESQAGADGAGAREPFTYVHRGTVVIGEIVASGRVRVHGEVRGDVRIDGVLEVAESGSVIGTSVEARVVKVLGRVTADVVASSKVEIWKGGVLTGNVSAPALDIEEGATFNGFSHMVTPAEDGDESVANVPVDAGAASAAPTAALAPADRAAIAIGRVGRHVATGDAVADAPVATAEEA